MSKSLRSLKLNLDMDYMASCDTTIYHLLFEKQINSLQTIIIKPSYGFSLYKSLIPNQNIRHIEILLRTIDDLYVLLSGIVPNVKTIIVKLRQTRLLSKFFHILIINHQIYTDNIF